MKKFIGLLMAGLLCMTGYAAPSSVTVAKTGGTTLQNVAINKYVWASSYRAMCSGYGPRVEGSADEHLSYFPGGVVTGVLNGNYPWMSRTAEGDITADPWPWIAIDLGKAYRAEYIDIYFPAGQSGYLELFAANSRTPDTDANAALDNGELVNAVKLGDITIDPSGKTVRYYIDSAEKFRYYKLARIEGIATPLTINQICIYSQDEANVLNLSLGKSFTTDMPSGTNTGLTDELFPAHGVNEGGWFSSAYTNNSATIDLGGEYIIERIDVRAASSQYCIGHGYDFFRRGYEIYGGTSLTGNHVSGIANRLVVQNEVTGPAGSVISHDIDSDTPMRYITYKRTIANDLFIAEITVYGRNAETEEVTLKKIYENSGLNADTIDLGGIYDVKYIELAGENLDDFYLYGSLEEDTPKDHMILLSEKAEAQITAKSFVRYLKAVPKGENEQPTITSATIYATDSGRIIDYAVLSDITEGKTAVIDGKVDTSCKITSDDGGVVFCLDKNMPVELQGVQITMAQSDGGEFETRTVLEIYGSTDDVDYTLIGRTSKQDIPDKGVLTMALDGAWKYVKIVPRKGELMGNLINYPGFGGASYTSGVCDIADVKILVYEKDEPKEASAVFDRANKKISYTFRNFSAQPKDYNYIAVVVDENGFITGSFKEEGSSIITVMPDDDAYGDIVFTAAESIPENSVMKLYIWDSLSGMKVLAPHISEAG